MDCLDNREMENYKGLAEKTNEAFEKYHSDIDPVYKSFRIELNNFMLEIHEHFANVEFLKNKK